MRKGNNDITDDFINYLQTMGVICDIDDINNLPDKIDVKDLMKEEIMALEDEIKLAVTNAVNDLLFAGKSKRGRLGRRNMKLPKLPKIPTIRVKVSNAFINKENLIKYMEDDKPKEEIKEEVKEEIKPEIEPLVIPPPKPTESIMFSNLSLSELMEFIYTDIRILIYGTSILNETYTIMGTDIDLSFVDIPEYRRFITYVATPTPETITTSKNIRCISNNLHGQTLLMLATILNIDVSIDDNLMVIDDFGFSALDYSTKLGSLGGYIFIQVSEEGYNVIFRTFNEASYSRYNKIRQKLEEYEFK